MNLNELKKWAATQRAAYNGNRQHYRDQGIKDTKDDTAEVFLRSLVDNVDCINKNTDLTNRCLHSIETALTQLTKIGLSVPEEKKRNLVDNDFDPEFTKNTLGL